MDVLPRNLAERLQTLTCSERAVAYLQVDANLNLIGAGGHLENYGLGAIQLGAPAVEQAVFLEGLLPLDQSPYYVPLVELSSGRAADLHLHADADTVWVLLFDVSADRDAARRVQQKAYEMTLLEEKQELLNQRLEAANAALLKAQREVEASRDALREELRRKQNELAEARTLQLSLVPSPYRGVVGGAAVSVDVVLAPAKEVGGDLVDHFRVGDDLLVLVLGDVADKGAGAALMMARTHALFRGLAARPDAAAHFRSPHDAVRVVNATLAAGNPNCTFVTLLLAAFDGASGQLTYVRAGHVPPFLRRTSGAIEQLVALGGPPLGLMEEANYASAVATLAHGDQILVVTDGITEATNPSGEMFGSARVARTRRAGRIRRAVAPAAIVGASEGVRRGQSSVRRHRRHPAKT